MKRARSMIVVVCMVSLCAPFAQGQAAEPKAVAARVIKSRSLPLNAVRLTGGPLKAAQDADAAFLLSVEPERAVSALRTAAGLEPKGEPLGGWDSPNGRQLTGHIAGHLLSGVSLMYAATGDEKFKQRADALVRDFAGVQEKHGDGYIGAQQDARRTPAREILKQVAEGNISANYETLNGLWSPWYVEHKLFAGLRDAYRHTGNAEALAVEKKLAAWVETTLAKLTDEQIQKMLEGEFGAINETLVDLYADTGDPRWLALSYKFEHKNFIEPLVQKQDKLGNTHGNHNIPTLLGSAARYAYAGKPEDLAAAEFFWTAVVDHHTFATGGNSGASAGEFFPHPDKLGAMISAAPSAATNESCNVYNMMKLTRWLFSFGPDARYADFLERSLFNHSLAQINPANGVMAYHVPVGQGVRRTYQGNAAGRINTMMTCCVGTGMENPGLYASGMYCAAAGEDKLWINFYAPSMATWEATGTAFAMESDMPEGETTKITLTLKAPKAFTLALRRPAWAAEGFQVTVNGEKVSLAAAAPAGPHLPASTYVDLARTWKTGDTIELRVPKTLRLEPTPDDPTLAAILWGPLVLAQDMGTTVPARGPARGAARGAGPARNVPAIIASGNITEWLKPADEPGKFQAQGRTLAAPDQVVDLSFVPLYRLHDRTQTVYMSICTPEEWARRVAAPAPAAPAGR